MPVGFRSEVQQLLANQISSALLTPKRRLIVRAARHCCRSRRRACYSEAALRPGRARKPKPVELHDSEYIAESPGRKAHNQKSRTSNGFTGHLPAKCKVAFLPDDFK
jgi:hypothetical protein